MGLSAATSLGGCEPRRHPRRPSGDQLMGGDPGELTGQAGGVGPRMATVAAAAPRPLPRRPRRGGARVVVVARVIANAHALYVHGLADGDTGVNCRWSRVACVRCADRVCAAEGVDQSWPGTTWLPARPSAVCADCCRGIYRSPPPGSLSHPSLPTATVEGNGGCDAMAVSAPGRGSGQARPLVLTINGRGQSLPAEGVNYPFTLVSRSWNDYVPRLTELNCPTNS